MGGGGRDGDVGALRCPLSKLENPPPFLQDPLSARLAPYWTVQRVAITSRGHVAYVLANSKHGVGTGVEQADALIDLQTSFVSRQVQRFFEKRLIDTV